MPTNLENLKDKTVKELTNITDALYENDPNGTNCNESYFLANVHNYLKDVGKTLYPSFTVFVNDNFTDIGNPYFQSIPDALDSFVNPSYPGMMQGIMYIYPSQGGYLDEINFDKNATLNIKGMNRYGTIINGNIHITAGITIFENITFKGYISIENGARVFFINCRQTHGNTSLVSSELFLSYCSEWGPINISGTNVNFFCQYVQDIKKAGDCSVVVAEGTTYQNLIMKYCELEGIIQSGVVVEQYNVNTEQKPIPTI